MEMTTRKAFSNTYRENSFPYSKPPQRLSPQQLDKIRSKGLWFNYDIKYSKWHKCDNNILFYIDCEEEEPKEEEKSEEEVTLEEIEESTLEEITPTTSYHALSRIITSQTLKIEGYIKKKKVIGDKIPVETMLSELDEEEKVILEREEIIEIWTRQLQNRSILDYLIKWKNFPKEDSTWEDESFIHQHPELLQRWGKHLWKVRGKLIL